MSEIFITFRCKKCLYADYQIVTYFGQQVGNKDNDNDE